MPHVDYFLKIDKDLIPKFSDSNSGGNYKYHRVGNQYFKYRKARIGGVDNIRTTYADELHQRVIDAINEACEDLISFWYRGIPEYFYRTEKGQFGSMLKSGDYLGAAVKDIKRKAMKYGGHSTSGRLREALFIYDISIFGAELAIKELPSTSTGDYVAILKSGAGPNSYAPYDPKRHIRLVDKPGTWGGFPSTYWDKWDHVFRKELMNVQDALEAKIADIVADIERQEARDLSRIRRGSGRADDIKGSATDRFKREREDRAVNKTRRR